MFFWRRVVTKCLEEVSQTFFFSPSSYLCNSRFEKLIFGLKRPFYLILVPLSAARDYLLEGDLVTRNDDVGLEFCDERPLNSCQIIVFLLELHHAAGAVILVPVQFLN